MSGERGYGGPRWKPEGIDPERPSPARVYDFLLGGDLNFDVDREVAAQLLAADPLAAAGAQANRGFLRRAVRFLLAAGVRQFLDIGSGIPTVGHVHDIAQLEAPESRVVYVDIDPVAVAHSRDILRRNDRTAVLQEDVRHPERIIEAPEVRQLLDRSEPTAVLLVGLPHFIRESDDPAGIVATLTAPWMPGSYLVMSHLTAESPRDMVSVRDALRRGGIDVTLRGREQVEAFFAGFDLVEPGVVAASQWRPEPGVEDSDPAPVWAGVGRKR